MKNWQRVLLFFAVWALVLVLPWWLSVLILAGLTIFVPNYVEVLFFGFIFDTIYSYNHTGLIVATIFLIAFLFVRTKIRT